MAVSLSMGAQATESAPEQQIMAKLRKITIKQLNLRQTPLKDVVSHLQKSGIDNDTADVPKDQKGVRIVLKLKEGSRQADIPVSFSATHISLYDALTTAAEMAGLKLVVGKDGAMLMPFNEAETPLVTKTYKADPVFPKAVRQWNAGLRQGGNQAERRPPASDSDELKEFFGRLGVSWPEGSSIDYRAAEKKLVVSNESQNIARMEAIMEEFKVVPAEEGKGKPVAPQEKQPKKTGRPRK